MLRARYIVRWLHLSKLWVLADFESAWTACDLACHPDSPYRITANRRMSLGSSRCAGIALRYRDRHRLVPSMPCLGRLQPKGLKSKLVASPRHGANSMTNARTPACTSFAPSRNHEVESAHQQTTNVLNSTATSLITSPQARNRRGRRFIWSIELLVGPVLTQAPVAASLELALSWRLIPVRILMMPAGARRCRF